MIESNQFYRKILRLIRQKAQSIMQDKSKSSFTSRLHSIPSNRRDLDRWAEELSDLISGSLISNSDVRDIVLILLGIVSSSHTGYTPEKSHLAQVRTYCKTNGRLQEVLAMLINPNVDSCTTDLQSSFFNEVTASDILHCSASLIENGYTVWPEILPIKLIDDLKSYAKDSLGWLMTSADDRSHFHNESIREYSGTYIKATTLLNTRSSLVTKIAKDQKLKIVIDSYLGGFSVLRSAQIWITRPSENGKPSSEAAQMYHYDLDTFKWLKVFIYLNDTNIENGPHCAFPGTHIPGAKHPELLARMYARIPDDDLDILQPEKARFFTGKCGTLIIGDTKAYHKGMPVRKGERMLLQLLYSCSEFGLSFGSEF